MAIQLFFQKSFKFFKMGLVLVGLLSQGILSNALFAEETLEAPLEDEIQFAIPYYMTEYSKSGVHAEVIKQAFKVQKISAMPVAVPIGRIYPMISNKEVQGGFLEGSTEETYMHPSDAYKYYLNAVAVSLKAAAINVKSPDDLKSHSVIAFQNAAKVLGDTYRAAVENNPNYKEKADQESQVRMLYTKRTDVIVLADSIFEYYRDNLPGVYGSQAVEVSYFLGKEGSLVRPVFADEGLKDKFEAGMKILTERNLVAKILKEWPYQ